MNAGILNRRIIIMKATSTQNEFGEKIDTWSTFVERWAMIEPLSGREYFTAKQSLSEIDKRVTVRYSTGIKPSMRLIYNNENYNIKSVININEANRELEIYCSKITT